MVNKAIFIDKDGTLTENVPHNLYPDFIRLYTRAGNDLSALKQEGFMIVVVSNQSGVVKGYFQEKELGPIWERINQLQVPISVRVDAFYHCPHHPSDVASNYRIDCSCRKPAPGLLLKASEELNIDLSKSWMIGDVLDDIEAGKVSGCRTILMDNGNETEWKLSSVRVPDYIVSDMEEAAYIIAEIYSQGTDFNMFAGRS